MQLIKFRKDNLQSHNNDKGFTLLELSISLIIVGMILSGAMAIYNIHKIKEAQEITEQNIEIVRNEVESFRSLRGRYPCPASYTAGRDNVAYGVETNCNIDLGLNPGECGSGVCIEESVADATIRVRRGTIPFRSMNIPESRMYDGYGNRLSYVLTENLAVPGLVDEENGGIDIVDNQPAPVSYIAAGEPRATYLIFSHGRNGVGAYTRDGIEKIPCNGVAAPDTGDVENCNTLDDDQAIYRMMEQRLVDGDTTGDGRGDFYDDRITYGKFSTVPLWQRSLANSDDIHTTDLTAVGFAPTDPTAIDTDVAAYISGNARISAGDGNGDGDTADPEDEGVLLTEEVCGIDGTDCYGAELLAGDEPQMQCPKPTDPASYVYVKGIAFGEVECTDQGTIDCPSGSVLRGIEADGDPMCTDAPCAAWTINPPPCGETHTLAASNHGESYLITPGDYRQETWECRSGNWTMTNATGECVCVPTSDYDNRSCWDDPAFGPGYYGLIQEQRDFLCPSGVWGSWYDTGNNCSCVVETYYDEQECTENGYTDAYVGTVTYERSTICPDGGYSAWTLASDTCACVTRHEDRTIQCEDRYGEAYEDSGIIIQGRDILCPAGTWTAWTDTTDTCSCSAITDNDDQTCQEAGYSSVYEGEVERQRTFNCGSDSWGAWGVISDTCTCSNSFYQDRTLDCDTKYPSGYNGEITERRYANCGDGSWQAWVETSDTCTCTGYTESRNVDGCTGGQVGYVTEERDFVCPAAYFTSWTEVSNNCSDPPDPIYQWVKQGTGDFETDKHGKKAGNSCTHGQEGQEKACWESTVGGYYMYDCVCQQVN